MKGIGAAPKNLMKEKLHVLVIPTWYPNGRDKLIGIYHKTFSKALAESGRVRVNMLYVDRQGLHQLPKYPFMKKSYSEDCGAYTVFARRMMSRTKISFRVQLEAYTRTLTRLFDSYVKENGRPDIIHAHVTVPAGYAAAFIGKKYNIPVVVTEHAFRHFSMPEAKDYVKFVTENAEMTAVSEYLASIITEKTGAVPKILPNVVDTSSFDIEREDVGDGVYRLVTVSALRPGKCIDDTVKALKILHGKGEIGKFEFTVIGDGESAEIYKNSVSELEMTDFVKFVGRKSPPEVAKYLAKADALVIASNIETFGIPAIEALASGVPVVCTRCKGPEGFLDSSCAEFCSIEDPEDLSRAIKRMYDRRGTFDREYLRSLAKKFSSEAIAESAMKIYEGMMK